MRCNLFAHLSEVLFGFSVITVSPKQSYYRSLVHVTPVPLILTEMEISAFLFQNGSRFQWMHGEFLSALLSSREPY